MCLVLIFGKRELFTEFAVARVVFSCEIAMNWSMGDSIETKAQKQSVIPEATPRASASCSFIPATWFVLEVTSTVPSLNSSTLAPAYLVVMVVWRSGFCFHFLRLFLLISSYFCGTGMCHRLLWALPCIFCEQQGSFGCFIYWKWLQKDKQAASGTNQDWAPISKPSPGFVQARPSFPCLCRQKNCDAN